MIGPRAAGLPRGRAALGGLLVAAAAVVVFAGALASTRGSSAGYVIAARPLAAGTILAPGDTSTQSFTLPAGARSQAFPGIAAVIGRVLSVAVTPGELIQSSMLDPSGGAAALRPVSIAVDPTSLAGLAAGDAVDVLAAAGGSGGAGIAGIAGVAGGAGSGSGPGAGPATPGGSPTPAGGGITVVMRGAALLSVTRPGSTLAPVSGSGTVVTLGVATLAEAETVVQAAHSGTVVLVQAEPSDGVGAGPAPAG